MGAIVATYEVITDKGIPITDSILLYCNNMSNIHLVRNSVIHGRMKHIEVHYHFIRERVQAGDVDLLHINTNLSVADIFTKVLGVNMLKKFMTDLGLTIAALLSLRWSTTQYNIVQRNSRSVDRSIEATKGS
mgnify:CR=1 FL=1